ncbi:MAG: hypothetical protein KBE72_11020 [Syntrophaceae bacterium]|nr:hypothetical protein [Syntrophaceae bacterium]
MAIIPEERGNPALLPFGEGRQTPARFRNLKEKTPIPKISIMTLAVVSI